MNLTLEEQEVHFSMSADDPNTWYCFSDYPKWQRRLESVGAVLVRVDENGIGRHYTLRANQVSVRKGAKIEISEERRAKAAASMRALHAKRKSMVQEPRENGSNVE